MATLRVLQQQGANRAVIVAFAAGVVLLMMAVSSLTERNKKVSRAPLVEGESPDFPVPSLPHLRSISVTGGQK